MLADIAGQFTSLGSFADGFVKAMPGGQIAMGIAEKLGFTPSQTIDRNKDLLLNSRSNVNTATDKVKTAVTNNPVVKAGVGAADSAYSALRSINEAGQSIRSWFISQPKLEAANMPKLEAANMPKLEAANMSQLELTLPTFPKLEVNPLPPVPPLKVEPSKLDINNRVSGEINISVRDPGGVASVSAAGQGGINLAVGKSKSGNYTSTNKAQPEAKR